MSEYTPDRLREWVDVQFPNKDVLYPRKAFLGCADAWEADRKDCHGYAMAASYEADRVDELTAEVRRLREALVSIECKLNGVHTSPLVGALLAEIHHALSPHPEPQEREEDSLRAHTKQCRAEVSTWPEWQQTVLGGKSGGREDDWTVHTGHSRPELGDMEAVEWEAPEGSVMRAWAPGTHRTLALIVPWEPGRRYRRVYHAGRAAVINDGSLEKWARWVVTARSGFVFQFKERPIFDEDGSLVLERTLTTAPAIYRTPGNEQDSLRSVLPEEK